MTCAFVGDYYAAARLYCKIKDYEAILSMPFDGLYLNNQKERDVLTFITDLVSSCPEEIQCKYPLTSVGFAYHLYMGGKHELYAKLCRLVASSIQNFQGMTETEINRIKGEFALLASFESYNDIHKMSVGHSIALSCLDGPSLFLTAGTPWTFGNVSILTMFWSKTGELEKELDDLQKCMPIYTKIVKVIYYESFGVGLGAASSLDGYMASDGEEDLLAYNVSTKEKCGRIGLVTDDVLSFNKQDYYLMETEEADELSAWYGTYANKFGLLELKNLLKRDTFTMK